MRLPLLGLTYGHRVRVRQGADHPPGPWPAEPLGTIRSLRRKSLTTASGRRRAYMVEFDEPQFDADGDGPYGVANVLDEYLEDVEQQTGE